MAFFRPVGLFIECLSRNFIEEEVIYQNVSKSSVDIDMHVDRLDISAYRKNSH